MARTKKMMRKLRYRLNKPKTAIIVKKNTIKKSLMAKRWKKLVMSPRGLEIKQNLYGQELNCYNQVGATFDLPTSSIVFFSSAVWPGLGTTDTHRIGDSINVKSMSYQMIFKQSVNINSQFIRVVFFTRPSDTALGTNFFKFGSSTPVPAMLCSIDRENYNVVSDKIYTLNASITNVSAAAKQTTGIKIIRGTVMKNQRVEFFNTGLTPKDAKHRLFVAVFSVVLGEVNQTPTASCYATFKVNYSD